MSLLGDLLAPRYLVWLLQGFGVTLLLSAAVCGAGTMLGLAACCLREVGGPAARRGVAGFVGLVRNTPLLVQLFVWYFAVAALLPGDVTVWLNTRHVLDLGSAALRWAAYETLAGFVGLTLYATAYIAEEGRAGLAGVRPAQREAALALGLTPVQAFRHIVLPQALRAMAPSFVNQWTALIKDTSLAYVIGVPELSFVAAQVNNRAMVHPAEIFLFVGAVDGALCLTLDWLAAVLAHGARRTARPRRGTPA